MNPGAVSKCKDSLHESLQNLGKFVESGELGLMGLLMLVGWLGLIGLMQRFVYRVHHLHTHHVSPHGHCNLIHPISPITHIRPHPPH